MFAHPRVILSDKTLRNNAQAFNLTEDGLDVSLSSGGLKAPIFPRLIVTRVLPLRRMFYSSTG